MSGLTAPRRRALEIIRDHGRDSYRLSPGRFAELMWPDSPCWTHSHAAGPYGSTRGGKMSYAAGGYLAKLRAAGLVEKARSGLYLTRAAEDLLNADAPAPVSICDHCATEMPAAEAETCEACGGTFDADCLNEHGCDG